MVAGLKRQRFLTNTFMKRLLVLIFIAVTSLQFASAQLETNVEFVALVKAVNAKLVAGNFNETTLAPELAQFDTIIAAQKGAKTDLVAQIIMSKAQLYLQVLNNLDAGEALVKKVKDDYADTKFAPSAAKLYEQIELMKAEKAAIEKIEKPQAELLPGKMFPDFSATDLAGKPLSVGALKGKVVLIDFWSTYCPPCIIQMSKFSDIYKKYHAQGFEIIGISIDGERKRLESFLKQNQDISWPQTFEASKESPNWMGKLAVKYGIAYTPCSILIGADGKIIAKEYHGKSFGEPLSGPGLEAAVAKALGK